MMMFSRISLPLRLNSSSLNKNSSSFWYLNSSPSLKPSFLAQQRSVAFRTLSFSPQKLPRNLTNANVTLFSQSKQSSSFFSYSKKSFLKPFSSRNFSMPVENLSFTSEEQLPSWLNKFPELPSILTSSENIYREHKFDEALQYYQKAIKILRPHRFETEPSKLFNFLVSRYLECFGRLGQIGEIKKFCEEFLFSEIKPNEHQLAALLWYGLGDVHSQNNFFDAKKAKNCYEQSLEESRQSGIIYKTNFGVYNGLGKLNLISGNFEGALHYFDLALESTKETPVLPQSLAHLHNNRAMVYILNGKPDEGLEFTQKALDTASQPPEDILEKQRALSLMASVFRQKKDYNKALEYLDKVLEISNQLNNDLGRVACMTEIGQIYSLIGKIDQARYLYEESLKISARLSDPNVVMQVQKLIDALPPKK